VEDLARIGTKRETIITLLRIPREVLANGEFSREFDIAIEQGTAQLEVDLLTAQHRLALLGKVSANIAMLKQFKGWGNRDSQPDARRGDQQKASSDLDDFIGKLKRPKK
jgi:hypothetical protein